MQEKVNVNGSHYSIDYEKQKLIVEQWKKMIDLADGNSEKRIKTNSIYITICTLITAGTNLLSDIPTMIIALIGILISILWYFSLVNYRQTNKYRYEVIREIEENMICQPITNEYKKLREVSFYMGNTIIEYLIPIVFAISFCFVLFC